MRVTFDESVVELVSVFDGEQEMSLSPSPLDRQGAEIVEECGEMIAQQHHS
jgi:hypothetical protein